MAEQVSQQVRLMVASRAYHVCEYCLIHEDDTFWGCQVDHIISRKHSGTSDPNNLAWACAVCNNRKGTDLGSLAGNPPLLVQFFNPRIDRWADCFQLTGARIEPLTERGSATAKLLQFNEDTRLRERITLGLIGRYPTIEALARMKE